LVHLAPWSTSSNAPRNSLHLAPRTSHLAPRATCFAPRTSRHAPRASRLAPSISHTSHLILHISHLDPPRTPRTSSHLTILSTSHLAPLCTAHVGARTFVTPGFNLHHAPHTIASHLALQTSHLASCTSHHLLAPRTSHLASCTSHHLLAPRTLHLPRTPISRHTLRTPWGVSSRVRSSHPAVVRLQP